tara:strand:- start:1281 stop:1757 length:477 start_codon:yes stop_codon:yes gene_type:complete
MADFKYDGRHLMLDVIVKDGKVLTDPRIGTAFLEDIVETIDMTQILPPITVKFPHAVSELTRTLQRLKKEGLENSETAKQIREDLRLRKEESYGYSSFLMIAESHLSIHTFPELNYFSFDCYSCKWFDDTEIDKILNKHFDVTDITTQLVKRLVPETK